MYNDLIAGGRREKRVMTIKHMIMAMGLAISIATGAAGAQVIGGEVEIDGSRDDVIFLGGDMSVRGEILGDISAVAGDGQVDANVHGSVHFFGGDVRIRGTVAEEVEIAGGDIEIDADVGGEVSAAGGDVSVRGSVGGQLSAAGGNVEISATVQDRVHLAGGYVGVYPESMFRNGAEIAGGEVELHGTIDGEVEIEGGEVTLAGTIRGDVEVLAEEVYILETARIEGRLDVRGPAEPVIADGAQTGEYNYTYQSFNFGAKHWDDIHFDIDGPWELIGAPFAFFGIAVPGAALLLGLLAVLMTPRGVSRIARTFRRKPLVSGFLGFISFALSPVVMVILTVLLAITVIGIVLIPFMWVLFWPFLLLCLALGAFAVGDLVFNRRPEEPLGLGMRLLSLLVVLAVSVALGAIPGLGAILGLVLVFIGLGAWLMSGGEGRQSGPVPADTSVQDDNSVSQG
jgi:cytoskeletal protein CcmA (bactofilin family)